MDKYIIIQLNMFVNANTVLITDSNNITENIGTYTLEEMPGVITALTHERNIYQVKISGNSMFSQLIEYGIGASEMAKYNERKIEIEVI